MDNVQQLVSAMVQPDVESRIESGRERLHELFINSQRKQAKAGTILVQQGQHESRVFYIQNGWTISHIKISQGKRHIIHIGISGNYLGLDFLFMPQSLPSNRTIEVIKDCTYYELDAATVQTAMISYPDIALFIPHELSVKYRRSSKHLAEMGGYSSEQKLAALLIELTARTAKAFGTDKMTFLLPLTQKQLAEYLGMTEQHVHRSLKKFQKESIISVYKNEIAILNMSALYEIVSGLRSIIKDVQVSSIDLIEQGFIPI